MFATSSIYFRFMSYIVQTLLIRTYGVYISNQKFDSFGISVLREIKNNFKKITDMKDVKNIHVT